MIQLAHTLELEVVAEGVETDPQLDFLSAASCDFIQGYLFSTPQPRHRVRPAEAPDRSALPATGRRGGPVTACQPTPEERHPPASSFAKPPLGVWNLLTTTIASGVGCKGGSMP